MLEVSKDFVYHGNVTYLAVMTAISTAFVASITVFTNGITNPRSPFSAEPMKSVSVPT
ncbi:large conductance mechanosensitive channel [Nocardia amikacinitolerans]|uniref:Large conductance mechanosensitive channel n=1 Tax=Nocardia amikacinitolerans TaxID=756689 RepID=A0A285LAF3_9NOCA|nr:hypothetical protein [Nocardia amikacinitolerans]MCP2296031.1 hypothetical protein [Nocardia amikacinitolerans]SNY81017.1 large conductance mechanosensitive channel [Nocardia amikacinitolerans]